MPSKTSSLNKEILLQIARNTGWISIIYFLGLLFALPIRMVNRFSTEENYFDGEKIQNLFYFDFPIQLILLVTLPVMMAVFLFRYLHVKHSANMIHSLPMTRTKLFHYHALTGLVFLIVPVLLTAFIIMMVHIAMDLGTYFPFSEIASWAGVTILLNLLFYSVGIFIAMMTGISVFHAVLTYILLIFPTGFTLLVLGNLKKLQYGFPNEYFFGRNIEALSPLFFAVRLDSNNVKMKEIIVFIVLSFVLYALSLFFYKKRKTESASEAIAFKSMKSVFKYGVTASTMLTGGLYFNELQNSANSWTVFGYAAGAIIGYFVSEMILQKTWRVARSYKGLIVFAAVTAIVAVAVNFSGIYEKNVPEASEVKSVLLSDDQDYYMGYNDQQPEYFVPLPMKEKENIEMVTKLHKQIIKDKKINQQAENSMDDNNTFIIKYELKNGSKMVRMYSFNERLYEDMIKPIYTSAEYKQTSQEVFHLNLDMVKSLSISNSSPYGNSFSISNPKDKEEAIAALKEDIMEESYEEYHYYRNSGFYMEVVGPSTIYNQIEIRPSFKKFSQWLEKKKLNHFSSETSNNVESILIGDKKYKLSTGEGKIEKDLKKQAGTVKVEDKATIDLAIKNASANPQRYTAVVKYKNDSYKEIIYFDEKHLPDVIKEKMK
ncbi:ABC transporter permease [Mesobacillus zeae]|uniref:ABC transporter permease n=1 Tax=Mesobacillus zeae TaxID=1917180 RepID=A0A398BFC5_9BACI|nr:ABC transporter permease [Mesobacillus zeae]RID88294.1 ABC transporter permease [Mesobacillus zeae]